MLTLIIVFLASGLVTALGRRYSLRRRILDIPNDRSSHAMPTPRGGGLGFVISYTIAALAAGLGNETGRVVWALMGGMGVAAVGAVDDVRGVPAKTRMLAHLAAGLWAVACVGPIGKLSLGWMELDLGWAGVVLSVLGIAWMINLTNFMDGIDGIAAIEIMSVCGVAGFIIGGWTNAGLQLLCWLLATAVAGFLPWNWPPARIFMGDVGSGFLGFSTAVLIVASSAMATHLLWTWLILLGVFVTDATLTLVRRLGGGERVWEAHRSHAYQHAAQRWGHLRVTTGVGMINLVWLAPLAYLAAEFPKAGMLLLVLAYAPLTVVAFGLGAGRREAGRFCAGRDEEATPGTQGERDCG